MRKSRSLSFCESSSRGEDRYCGLEVSEARRLRALEEGNRGRRELLAEAVLDVDPLKDLLARTEGSAGKKLCSPSTRPVAPLRLMAARGLQRHDGAAGLTVG